MPDISTAAISSSLRVGLHVVSNYKRPVLEIYHQVYNKFTTVHENDELSGADENKKEKHKTRLQEVFIQFTLVNIGGVRAEDVDLSISGDLQRNSPRQGFGGAFKTPISQFPPGQSHLLFRFEDSDLYQYPEEGGPSIGLKEASFTITISYNAPSGVLNWILSLPYQLRGKKRFTTQYTFSPQFVTGDLPPPEYAT